MAGHLRPILGLWICALALTGCAHHKHLQSSPQQLYQTAHHDMDEYNFNGAIKVYEQLTAIFPFTDQAHQAQLDLIYAYYRAGETDSAIDACDTFIRENPTHPRVDYAYYMEGMTNFEKQPNPIEKLFHVDLSKRPPTTANKAFAAFRTVVTEYPKSAYAYDARQRMVYLRDRLASYDVEVARYYLTRGAYIGAVRRAKLVIENYEGAPATKEAARHHDRQLRPPGDEDPRRRVPQGLRRQFQRPGGTGRGCDPAPLVALLVAVSAGIRW